MLARTARRSFYTHGRVSPKTSHFLRFSASRRECRIDDQCTALSSTTGGHRLLSLRHGVRSRLEIDTIRNRYKLRYFSQTHTPSSSRPSKPPKSSQDSQSSTQTSQAIPSDSYVFNEQHQVEEDASTSIPKVVPDAINAHESDVASSATETAHDNERNSRPKYRSKLRMASDKPNFTSRQERAAPDDPLPDLRHGIPSTLPPELSDLGTKDPNKSNLDLAESLAIGRGREGDGSTFTKEHLTSIERRRRRLTRNIYIIAALLGFSGIIWSSRNWEHGEEAQHPEAPNGFSPLATYGRIKARFKALIGYWVDPAFPDLLPDQHPDFVPPGTPTLVLSLEDLLVHSKWTRQKGWEVAKRPGVDYFLHYLSQYYELVIFTTVPSMNANNVIAKLDPYRIVQWPLFREATRFVDGQPVKDLSALNRDLSKVIVIDTVPDHIKLQPSNGIILPKWNGQANDAHAKDLVALIPFLEYLANMSIDDYRRVIQSFEGTDIPTEFNKREAKIREEFNRRLKDERKRKGQGSSGSGLGSMIGFKPGGMMQMQGDPNISEGLAQGKMLIDLIRERGQRNYAEMQKNLRVNGPQFLKELEDEQKRQNDENWKSWPQGIRQQLPWKTEKGDLLQDNLGVE